MTRFCSKKYYEQTCSSQLCQNCYNEWRIKIPIAHSWTLNNLFITYSRDQTGIDVVSSAFVVGIRKCNFNGHVLQ